MDETQRNPPTPARANRFSDDVRQLAYEIWAFQEDRSPTRTHRKLAEKIRSFVDDEEVPIDPESAPIPTLRQVQNWIQQGNWRQRAMDDMVRLAPFTHKEANVRLFGQLEKAQDVYSSILSGELLDHPKPGNLQVLKDTAKDVLVFAGVGTNAGLMPPQMPQQQIEAVNKDATPQELGARMREKLMELREGRR